MRVLLMHITLRRSGARARKGSVIEVERLTVGRGTDNALHIPGLTVALHHCVFVKRPDGIYVEPVDARDLRVNGRVTPGQRLTTGDVVRVGQRELRVLDLEGSTEDLVLEIEEVAPSGLSPLRAHTRIGIERGPLTRRALSWAFVVAILAFALGIPLLHRALRSGDDRAQPVVHPRPPAKAPLEYAARLVETAWISGPLARNHSHLANDCGACHASGFVRVRDQECTACHSAMGRHTAMEIPLQEIDSVRCAACHVEHNGETGLLGFGSELCTSCHADIKKKFPETTLIDVNSFSKGHPEFRPAVVVDSASRQRERVPLPELLRISAEPEAAKRERSGLKFSHTAHLQPGLMDGGGNEVTLGCESCHTPDRGHVLMAPVEYERHCQSCHDLKFEKGDDRQAPHEEAELVRKAVFEFYSGLALGNEGASTAKRKKPLDIPTDRAGAMTWALEKSSAANRRLLGASGTCAFCHTVNADGGSMTIVPVVVPPAPSAERWFSLAVFEHGPHEIAGCVSCHDVTQAKDAGAVAMPGIDRCRDCHGDTGKAGEVDSTCITCHDFHHPAMGLMGAGLMQASLTKPAAEPVAEMPPTRDEPAEAPKEEAPVAEEAPPAVEEPPPAEEAPPGEQASAASPATEQPVAAVEPAAPIGSGRVQDGAEIRSRPDEKSVVLGDFDGETSVEILETKDAWSLVRAPTLSDGSIEGWVRSTALAAAAKPRAEPKPAAEPAAAPKTSAKPPVVAKAPSKAAASDDGPDDILLQPIVGTAKKRPPTPFTHKAHHADYSIACETCHHPIKALGNEPPPQMTCSDSGCHTATECDGKVVPAKNAACPSFEEAYHIQCIGCHKKDGGPTKCAECHSG